MPSEDDAAPTERQRAAGDLIGVRMVDHLVIADAAYFSFSSSRIFHDPPASTPPPEVETPSSPTPHAQLVLPHGKQ